MSTTNEKKERLKLTAQDIATIGMMVAVIEVCKVVLMGVPNVELTTFWIIMFSIYFGNKVFLAIPVFILIEGAMFGFQLWWIMYLYMWPSLALLARIVKKIDSVMVYSILSSAYGFLFGFFCAMPYLFIGMADGGIKNGLYTAFSWWVAGIPFDLVHAVGNLCAGLFIYPLSCALEKLNSKVY